MTRSMPGFLLPENKALEADDAVGGEVVWKKRPGCLR